MKKLIILGLIASAFSSVATAEWVNGYVKKDGTYVNGHQRSEPDQYRYNNYGSQSYGGNQRDEFSNGYGATNQSNPNWNMYDNNNNGVSNGFDRRR